jgi:hypothetical protein
VDNVAEETCDKEKLAEDRIYSSRKFVLALICIVVIFLGGLVSIHSVAFAGIYPTFIGGILGIAAAYITGNVANDFLNNKVKASIEHAQIAADASQDKDEGS